MSCTPIVSTIHLAFQFQIWLGLEQLLRLKEINLVNLWVEKGLVLRLGLNLLLLKMLKLSLGLGLSLAQFSLSSLIATVTVGASDSLGCGHGRACLRKKNRARIRSVHPCSGCTRFPVCQSFLNSPRGDH